MNAPPTPSGPTLGRAVAWSRDMAIVLFALFGATAGALQLS